MCRPPDIAVSAGGPAFEDGLDPYPAEGVDDWNNEVVYEAADVVAGDRCAASVLGKREPIDGGNFGDLASRSSKLPRAGAPVSSAFDTAAASFVARMGKSMLQDLQRQQQQRLLAAAAVEGEESLLLQQALLEQRAKLHQLQQLQLLKQLQQPKQVIPSFVLPEQQRLLLAQQQLLQQSQNKLLEVMGTAPVANPADPSAPWASLLKQQQDPSAVSLLGVGNAAAAQNKIQQWAQAGLPAPVAKSLPAIHPKPVSAAAAVAVLGTGSEMGSAAAVFGLGHSGLRAASLGFGEEKKVKRMQSNRASAKRSRQRRQARLEELDKSTAQLQEENSTMCAKLEEAEQEINSLEEFNRSLVGEVTKLRKILGLEVKETKGGACADVTVSGAGGQQSCIETEDCTNTSVEKGGVKEEADEGFTEEDVDEDGKDLVDASLDWLGSLPLSPSADTAMKPESPLCSFMTTGDAGSPASEQFFVQADPFSELLACLDG